MAIYDTARYQVGDIQNVLTQYINGLVMETYLLTKYNWSYNTILKINWDALSKTLKKNTQYQYTKMIQLMYNWQNINQQKEKINPCNDGMCPTGCKIYETYNHYLLCQHKEMMKTQTQYRNDFKHTLDQLETYSGITSTILRLIRYGIQSSLDTFRVNSETDHLIMLALLD